MARGVGRGARGGSAVALGPSSTLKKGKHAHFLFIGRVKVSEQVLLSDTRAGHHSILKFREHSYDWSCKVVKSLHVVVHRGTEVNRTANVTSRTLSIAIHVHSCTLTGMAMS